MIIFESETSGNITEDAYKTSLNAIQKWETKTSAFKKAYLKTFHKYPRTTAKKKTFTLSITEKSTHTKEFFQYTSKRKNRRST